MVQDLSSLTLSRLFSIRMDWAKLVIRGIMMDRGGISSVVTVACSAASRIDLRSEDCVFCG